MSLKPRQAFTFFSAKKVNNPPDHYMIVGQEKLPIQKTCLPRSRQAHLIIIKRAWIYTTYIHRTFSILSLSAISPVSRQIKSRFITSSYSFVLVSLRLHLN